ncbi:hypothetical protein ABPG74_010105 [Tetrahymena malaccensis]
MNKQINQIICLSKLQKISPILIKIKKQTIKQRNNKLNYSLYYPPPPHSLCSPLNKLLYKIKFNIIYYFLFDLVEMYLKLMCQMKQISKQISNQLANQIPSLNQNIPPIIQCVSIFQILITTIPHSNNQINIKFSSQSQQNLCRQIHFLIKNTTIYNQLIYQLIQNLIISLNINTRYQIVAPQQIVLMNQQKIYKQESQLVSQLNIQAFILISQKRCQFIIYDKNNQQTNQKAQIEILQSILNILIIY